QVLAGDREAFGHLIEKYMGLYFDLACRILGNRSEAEDVLQDVFLDVYRPLPDFKHRARFSTWVYSILLNHARNRLRHNKVVKWSSLDVGWDVDESPWAVELPAREKAFDE